MTTAATNTTVSMASNAAFQAWVAEIVTMLFTTLGVTQTADTGQINPATVTIPGTTQTSAGYVIGRFNDTAQSTSPIFFKLEFGTGSTTTIPALWITISTGSNGSGTLNGTVGTRVAAGPNQLSITSPGVTPYITRACYNAADGVLWLVWKNGGVGNTNQALGGFAIFRSNDNAGAVTTDAVALLTNSSTATGQNTGDAAIQYISYLTSTAYNGTNGTNATNWCAQPLGTTVTLFGSNAQFGFVWQYTPVLGITNWAGIALVGEFAVGTTTPAIIVGSTTHTYIAVGGAFGTTQLGAQSPALAATGGTAASFTLMLPWE